MITVPQRNCFFLCEECCNDRKCKWGGEVSVLANTLYSRVLLITVDYVKMNYTVLSLCLAAIKPWEFPCHLHWYT